MKNSVRARPIATWISQYPLLATMMRGEPVTWFNPAVVPLAQSLGDIDLDASHVADASARLRRFAPYLIEVFPELCSTRGIIESEVVRVDAFAHQIAKSHGLERAPHLFVKKDSHLPVAGSVKARGGIYEVLAHAERLVMGAGFLNALDDYRILAQPACRAFFNRHKVAVGSTGNLGMSIGIAAAALGFEATVHMSANARQWKKDKLRSHGVRVVEHTGDYGQAVRQGRREAGNDPSCYFVDDENSRALFLGYAVAGERLKSQFDAAGLTVDSAHPLFVYLPCGVGGAPGGITFGLKLAFGDHVHCIFAEPTQSPCMLIGVYTGLHDEVAVQDFGISNLTAADGLAVGRPSGFVGRSMQRMIDGYYTLTDDEMYSLLYIMERSENLRLEPSALAGALGVARVLRENQGYRERMGIGNEALSNAHHLIWATGGGMVPDEEFAAYLSAGKNARISRGLAGVTMAEERG